MSHLTLAMRLALRNVVRYLRRSLITSLTIALGMVMMLAVIGMSEGMYARAVDTAARSGSGHVVVQVTDYDVFEPKAIADPEAVRQAVGQLPGAVAAERVLSPLYATSDQGSLNAMALGLDPVVDKDSSILPEGLVAGEWLPDSPPPLPAALLGRGAARKLGLGVHDRLVLMAQGDGELGSQLVTIQGIFATGNDELDENAVVLDKRTLQAMLGQPGAVHQVAVLLPEFRESEAARDQLAAALQGQGVDVLTWAQAMPDLGGYVALDRAGAMVLFVILFAIVGLAVLNAVLMSVLERTHEFGVLLAVGTRPALLFNVVVFEAVLLSVGAALVGAGVGMGLVSWFGVHGLDLSLAIGAESFDAGGINISGLVYTEVPFSRLRSAVGMVVGLTVIGSLYPAWAASRIAPVEAIRHD